MNKVNFNSLSGFKAPDAWIQKAAAIPGTAVKKRVFPLCRPAAAAGIVLVSVIGLLTFLVFGNNRAPITVRSNSVTVGETIVDESGKTDEPVETIAALSTDAEGDIGHIGTIEPSVTLSQPKIGRASLTESALPPTDSVTETFPGTTGQPDRRVPTASYEAPSPVSTEAVAPTVTPDAEPSWTPLTDGRFYVTVKNPSPAVEAPAVETEDPIVFCRMYDAVGDLIGSGNFYAEEKRATIVSFESDDSFVVTYDPLEKGLPISRGCYTYVMYDYDTGTELCRGTVEYE